MITAEERAIMGRLEELEGHLVGSSGNPALEHLLLVALETGLKLLSREALVEYRRGRTG